MVRNEETFSKVDTKIVKGLAIILMLLHHLWSFPERIGYVKLSYFLTIFGKSSLEVFGGFGNICIALFFFVGGYGIYISSKRNNFNILSNIKKIYIRYWKIFLIFIPIGFLFFRRQVAYCNDSTIYTVFSKFSWNDVIKNFLGLEHTLNYEWWFLKDYIIAILTFPIIKKLFENKSVILNLFIIFILMILTRDVFPKIGDISSLGRLNNNYLYSLILCQKGEIVSCYWLGILFAKDDLLVKLRKKLNDAIKLNILVDLIGIMIIIYLRQFAIGQVLDIVYVPFLVIFFIDFIKYFYGIGKTFRILGNNSTNMWLVHTFYCYYFSIFVRIVTFFKTAFLCLIVLILLSLASSIIVDFIWELLDKLLDKVKYLIHNIKKYKLTSEEES